MTLPEAIALIRPAVPTRGGTWADFGAGTGLFSLALARVLGPSGRVLAVERDEAALAALRGLARVQGEDAAEIVPVRGDFERLDRIGELAGVGLAGALFANALHFAPDAAAVLTRAAHGLQEDGRLVVVEYDRRPASRWVPYPVSVERLGLLARQAGLRPPMIVGERASAYGGVMYCAVLDRPDGFADRRGGGGR